MLDFFVSRWNIQGAARQQPADGIPPNPKVFFANERTFLSWLQLCLILGAVAIGLLNFSNKLGQIAGMIFAIISVGFMFYSLIQFNIRADRLQKKEKGVSFEDMVGSLVMITVVFLAIAINFSFKMASPSN
ncbi:hypothetical protein BATDEDRAFT_28079 [Batrachochytrium dendrobatidis JAM81]|uniref:DUF202 domain-containing protein n=2 Tax=Batrachochytrium dendrobatidis TaxID=109871 RepID=F4PCS1_BATDJ|nr:uncharacterized protein BATDEDRAFT_28079 [Batrachochytrium dendrobatidis JAM81]EGF76993.1 hypothetical protein BATDEDRAFT_28079 [Batrachochytrium dendrobatidis JAM81]KAJ8330924.1 vacuolar transporter chaperone [Batrachochytrium dendrobatidis]KAK5672499.1 vacuolar transporter chaperone [Batrachochytrium dendrobatidis]OAJ44938.1 hypothetical protein BDEG_28116 [Batrachochytrium dendrobatidis JEL423]|eukprot:XP_006682399.1 hypothetical protein BATDEDRAFT_28079 [Batrachochytrium dendrobatidis JAM81]